jgi:hypothetical protein
MSHTTQVLSGKGTTYTTIAQRLSLDGPEMEVGTVETTHLDSAAKTFRATLPDGGEMSGTLEYDPQDAGHVVLFNLIWSPTPNGDLWNLVFSDNSIANFTGILTGFKPTGMEVEERLQAEFKIKVSGVIVLTPGS